MVSLLEMRDLFLKHAVDTYGFAAKINWVTVTNVKCHNNSLQETPAWMYDLSLFYEPLELL
jgi:hypothetical protein